MISIPVLGYDAHIGHGALTELGAIARATVPSARRWAVITDDAVGPLYAERVVGALGGATVARVFSIPPGESHKTRVTWSTLTDALLAQGYGRDSAVVALGGGVVGDLAGFVAATFMRGIPVIQAPTTLLAMIDASIGGKTGVDTEHGKNLVGAFHQPAAVVADTAVLATLPPAQRRAGLAEAIKHGVIANASYLDAIVGMVPRLLEMSHGSEMSEDLTGLVAESVRIKADVVRRDEREGGLRKVLNFGHTIGHAVEHLSGYAMLHGEAVACGMVVETRLAESSGVAERGTAERVRAAVLAAGLPDAPPPTVARLGARAILEATRTDKKARAGQVEYALPARIGAMAGEHQGWSLPVPDALVLETLAHAPEMVA